MHPLLHVVTKIIRLGLLTLFSCLVPLAQAQSVVPHERSHITLKTGQVLPLRTWASPDTPKAIVIGVHGFNDYSAAFEPLAQKLVPSLQATFYAYDHRSFGANPGRGHWPGSQILVQDLIDVVHSIKQMHPTLPITLVGESMGAALVHMAIAQSSHALADQVVLQAPAVWGLRHMPWFMATTLNNLNIFAPQLKFGNFGARTLGIVPSNDKQVIQQLDSDDFFIKKTTVNSLHGLAMLMDQAFETTLKSQTPTLVLFGLEDKVIPPYAMCRWLQHQQRLNPNQPAQFYIYPQGWHMLTRQTQAEQVIQDIHQWLQNPHMVSATPSSHNLSQAVASVCL
jgi:alpha-beta hydrolase superfamily lysophospholipase